MGSALSKLLPAEFPPSHLFSSQDRADRHTLPPRPASVCRACWAGPFAAQFCLPLVSPWDGQPEADPQRFRAISYRVSLADLRRRANAGCVWCRFLDACNRGENTAGQGPTVEITIEGYGWMSPASFQSMPTVGSQDIFVRINERPVLIAHAYAAPDDPAAAYIAARSPIVDVGSPRALALAREQIDECAHGHEHCKALAVSSPRFPTRLVDCADLDCPRLVFTAGGHGEYLALSYVWGGDQVHKTTTSNISAYEEGIPRAQIPDAIYDAIYVTHTLGFRWLWIDSLCIIQDSDEDKRHEIGRMHDVYRYAHLTLIAGGIEKVGDSFLYERPALRPIDFDSNQGGVDSDGYLTLPFICPPLPPASGDVSGVHQTAQSRVGQVHLASTLGVDMSWSEELGRISTRAWCMQEFLLSPRSLIFTSKTLQLRCLTTTRAVGNGLSVNVGETRLADALFLPDPPAADRGSDLRRDVLTAWAGIVKDYSSRKAGLQSDKLVACAAVAQQFHRVLRTDYLAGLWRDTLLTDLLWENDRIYGDRFTRPTAYRAPSWSWAAVDGELKLLGQRSSWSPGDPIQALTEIAECQVELKDCALTFGEVTGGMLILRGTLLPCGHPGRWPNDVVVPPLERARRLRWGLDGSPDGSEDCVLGSAEPGLSHSVSSAHYDCVGDEALRSTWVVPLARDKDSVQGLILALAGPTNVNGAGSELPKGTATFRRIGFFQSYTTTSDPERKATTDALWDPITRAAHDGEFPLEIRIV